ncbi:acyl-CoA dehydrogenase [Peribacillus saganii]|uniref:Acyl-CoA dehydrogenase n=1 Tax=Peribacillus saganii TaxID=2303992 RepID=A0A372LBG3_9BACI|nr:acyl-CoA dehydrogenase family protein [Peribacillus saganii]RFU62812.1 acyl-CoA dehydrogenase [Peribacillus saganii]
MKELKLPSVNLPEEASVLQQEVRQFLTEERSRGTFNPKCDSWLGGYSAEFSRKIGEKGWLGMTWPKQYGGHERSALERFVVTEELLASGAPVAAHWFGDRQTGPLLLRYGTEKQKKEFLPKLARGEIFFAIGLSEPNSGSDLASVSTRARKEGDKWVINGSKIWTSGAHHAHYMITLCRTSPQGEKKQEGLSQILLDLSSPGVTIRPIYLMTGEHHFNEVIMEDVVVPEDMIIGEEGQGWKQSMAELAYERSGPERFMSTYPLLEELVKKLSNATGDYAKIAVGRLISRLWVLRKMSLGVAALLEKGTSPDIAAALVKDLGTQYENEIINVARLLIPSQPSMESDNRFDALLAQAILHAPGFTLRGGTTEILRGIIARGLGVR